MKLQVYLHCYTLLAPKSVWKELGIRGLLTNQWFEADVLSESERSRASKEKKEILCWDDTAYLQFQMNVSQTPQVRYLRTPI
jgi:hypothetical protein